MSGTGVVKSANAKADPAVEMESPRFGFLGLAGSFSSVFSSCCVVVVSLHVFPPQSLQQLAEMDSGPFSRRSWATQSLRVTAKELSLSGRGRHNAIAERFSK